MAQIPQNRQFQEAKVPSHWGTSERRYAQGVNDLFERLFYMFGRLSKDDLAKPLNKEITDATGNILRIESDVDQVQLTLTTVQGDVSSLTLSQSEFATQLENAQGNITTLQQTATGLQTQVNNLGNRNRTYLPGTVPSVSERVEGDLLIDTANGNILKRWNGSAWVAVQDGAISIAQQQADKIQWLVASGTSAANMTLTSQLYSLMAANIDLSANNSIKLAVSGGTNLLTGTSDTYANLVHSNVYFRTFASSTIASLGLVPGEVITVRAYFKTDANVPAGGYQLMVQQSNGSENTVMTSGQYILPSSEGFSSVTSTIRYDTVSLSVVGLSYGLVNFTGTEQYKWLKIERGTMATDWSPSPSDPASGVKTSKIEIGSDFIDIESGGTLTLDAADDIKIGSGSDTLVTFTDDAIEAKADTLNFSANDSIKLAVSGGTNLLTGTSDTYANLVHSNVYFRTFASSTIASLGLVPGEVITVRAYFKTDANVPAGGYQLMVQQSNGSENTVMTSGQYILPSSEGFSSVTSTIRYDTVLLRVVGLSYGLVNFTGTEQYKWLKIERGTMATDWSPSPSDPASGVKTSKVTIDDTGIAMTTGGTFTTTSQNFNIDAAGNVVMKGTVEAAAGKIGGLKIENGVLKDNATNGTKMQINPLTGSLILNDLEILQNAGEITFRNRMANLLRHLYFQNPNGSIMLRTANPTNSNWMTRFDVEMPTAAKPDGRTYNYGDSYIDGNCSAQSFTDRTPAYFGDALDELRWASGSKAKGIDHSSLPKFAQKTIIGTRINEDGEKEDYEEEGRDLGAMVSVLTRAVQQLADKVDSQQRLIEDLNRRVSA